MFWLTLVSQQKEIEEGKEEKSFIEKIKQGEKTFL